LWGGEGVRRIPWWRRQLAVTRRNTCFEEIEQTIKGVGTRNRGIVLALVSIVGFCLIINGSWKATPDSALYLELGESLAEGHGYVFNGEPHTYVPPGYPGMVAAVARVFGESFLNYRIFMALLGMLTAMAGYLFILRLSGPETAFVVGGVFAVNHALLSNATFTSSDVPFALVSLVGLNAVISAAGTKNRVQWTLLSGLLLGLPALIRINGWGIPPAAALYLFCQWKDRPYGARVLWTAVFLLFAILPGMTWEWYKWSFPSSHQEGTYLNAVTGRDLATQLTIILNSAWKYIPETSEALTGLSIKTGVLELIVPGLALIGMAVALCNGERLLTALTAIQFCGLFLSPAGSRYILVLLPGLYLFFYLGLLRSWKWISPIGAGRIGKRIGPNRLLIGVFVAFTLFNVGHNAITIMAARSAVETPGAESSRDLPFFAAARWLKAHAAGEVVLTMHPRVLHYLSGLPTVELVRSGVPEHEVWVNAQQEIRKLLQGRNPTFLFSDSRNTLLYGQVMKAIENLGLELQEIPEAGTSPRFHLWKIER
jgi:4-amino-4-deoxy-L-arabinose transferase-like glycosyltransferase